MFFWEQLFSGRSVCCISAGNQPFNAAAYAEHLSVARQYCVARGYALEILAGAEVLYTPLIERTALAHRLPVLEGTDTVLLEFAPQIPFREMESAVYMLRQCGYHIILAHMERYECLYGRGARRLKEKADVRYQVNCSTVLEGSSYVRGILKKRTVRGWLADKLVDFVASDAHDISRRPSRMREAYGELARRYGQSEADRMMRAGRVS